MERCFRGPTRNDRVDLVNRAVDDFNDWILRENERIDGEHLELENLFRSMERAEERIKQLDVGLNGTPDRKDTSAINAYNAEMDHRNELVAHYEEMSASYGEGLESYRLSVERYERDADERRRRVALEKKAMEEWVNAYDAWIESGGDKTFHCELNRLFAALCAEHGNARPADGLIERVRRIRNELGEWAAEQEKVKENGLIILPALVGGRETCWFILDTGASLVSLSPEIVDALGWGDLLGDEVESAVAGGLTVRGRTIRIPKIEFLDVSAEWVDGKVLRESHIGVDGLLGRSFLKQFRLIVEDGAEEGITLERLR